MTGRQAEGQLRAEAEPPRNPFPGKRASQVCKNALKNTRLWKSAARTKLKIGKPKTKPKSQNYKLKTEKKNKNKNEPRKGGAEAATWGRRQRDACVYDPNAVIVFVLL